MLRVVNAAGGSDKLRETIAKSEATAFFAEKATGGKYVKAIKEQWGVLTTAQIIFMCENVIKILPLARKEDDDYKAKWANYRKGFENSKPIKNREAAKLTLAQMWVDLKLKQESYSAAAWVQAYADKIYEVAEGNFYVEPQNQSFSYCRAMYMVLDEDVIIDLVNFRTVASFTVAKEMFKIISTIDKTLTIAKCVAEVEADSTQLRPRIVRNWLKVGQAGGFDPKTTPDTRAARQDPNWRGCKFITVEVKPEEMAKDLTLASVASFLIEFRFMLQARDFRKNGAKRDPAYFKRISAHIKDVFDFFGDTSLPKTIELHGGIKATGTGNITRAAWWDKYHLYAKIVKALCAVWRKACDSRALDYSGNAIVKDYSDWTVDTV